MFGRSSAGPLFFGPNWLPMDGSKVVSEMLGHSEKTLNRDYKALVTKAEANAFWSALSE